MPDDDEGIRSAHPSDPAEGGEEHGEEAEARVRAEQEKATDDDRDDPGAPL